MSYISRVDSDTLLESKYYNPAKAIAAGPFCNKTIPTCSQGEELKHSYFKDPHWSNSYGWHCTRCPVNSFKDRVGNTKCTDCIYPLQTDLRRERCFDPFYSSFPRRDDAWGVVVSTVTGITVLLVLSLMAVFIKYRDTPIVKHANRPMTALHLFSHLILAMVPASLFFGQPNRVVCICRPLIVGVCFTINISVNIAKTQKLHLIFASKTIHSRSKKTLIECLELVVIGGLSLADAALFIVCYVHHYSVDVIMIYHDRELIKEITCSNNGDIIIQLSFVLLIILTNGIQAFRSRGLP